MLDRPTTLSVEERRRLDERRREVEVRVLEAMEAMLRDIESEKLAERLSSVAFQGNDALPKRGDPPKLEPALLVAEIFRSYASDDATLDQLLRFTVATSEYYDITDDLFDDDVSDSHRDRVFVCQQLLVPEIVRCGAGLDSSSIPEWADRTTRMLESCVLERRTEQPTVAAYEKILNRQAELFGSLTGLAATAATDDEAIHSTAATIGRAYFAFEQLLLDGDQFADGEDSGWNAWQLASTATVRNLLEARRAVAHRNLSELPDERAATIRGLFAVDLEEWMATRDLG
jgi:hypothetical protein